MAILYALVARRSVVLAEFSLTYTNASVIARQILEKIPGTQDVFQDDNFSYSQDRYIFHVKRTYAITVLCMAQDTAGRRIPFLFLEDINERFMKAYHRDYRIALAYGMHVEFSRVLIQQMDKYNNDLFVDWINRKRVEMSQVRNVMLDNIDRLELLVDRTANMQEKTFHFRKQACRFQSNVWWQNVKLAASWIILLLIILYVVLAFMCHGVTLPSCIGH